MHSYAPKIKNEYYMKKKKNIKKAIKIKGGIENRSETCRQAVESDRQEERKEGDDAKVKSSFDGALALWHGSQLVLVVQLFFSS